MADANRRPILQIYALGAKPRGIRVRGTFQKKLNSQVDALSRLPSNEHTTEHGDTQLSYLIMDVTSDEEEEREDTKPFI